MNGFKYLSKEAREKNVAGFFLYKKYCGYGYDVARYDSQESEPSIEVRDYLLAHVFLKHIESITPNFLENEEDILEMYTNMVGACSPCNGEKEVVTMEQLGINKENRSLVDAAEGFIRSANLYEGNIAICIPQRDDKGNIEAFGVVRNSHECFSEKMFEDSLKHGKVF